MVDVHVDGKTSLEIWCNEVPDIASDCFPRLDVFRWQIGPIDQTKLWCQFPIDLSDVLGARRGSGRHRGDLYNVFDCEKFYPQRR